MTANRHNVIQTIDTLRGLNARDNNTVYLYVEKWGARVEVYSTESKGEYLAVVLHDDHVFAAASSTDGGIDALERLAARIRAKSA